MALRFSLGIVIGLVGILFALSLMSPDRDERRAALGLPASPMSGDAGEGQALFLEKCAACHGPGLGGTEQGPPLLSGLYKPSHHSDLAIRLAVKNGVAAHHWQFGDMPPVPGVTPEQVTDLIAFIRAAQRKAGLLAAD